MLSGLVVTRYKMTPIKSLLMEIMGPQEANTFFQSRHEELNGTFMYIFKVTCKNQTWKINKRLVDFEELAARVTRKLGVDFSQFGGEGDIPEQALFQKLQQYLNLCMMQGNSLTSVMLRFLEDSGFAYQGLEKYKEISMLKQAGGRYQEGCFKCGSIFGSWKIRYFILHNEGIVYKDEYGNVKEYLSYDYDFKMTYGKAQTDDSMGIILTSTHRKLKLKALSLFDWIQFIYYVKIGFSTCEYASINKYGSFAPVRQKCLINYFVDGQEYFSSVAMSMVDAKKEVFITDWWLSPQFYLVRPINEATKEYRLDRILHRVAKRGVKVMIIVYHESTFLLNDSLYTKQYLQSLHQNIKVLRHPATVLPTLWSHHQKMVIVDQTIAYVGGLDLCYGRWDTQRHHLFDPENNLYPGIEYNNIRNQDISKVRQFQKDQYQRHRPRLPWHDISCCVQGEVVWDLSRHFIQYWNYASFQIQVNDRSLLMRDPQKRPNIIKKKIGQGIQKFIDIKNRIKEKLTGRSPEKPHPNRIQAYLNNKIKSGSFIQDSHARQTDSVQLQTTTQMAWDQRHARSMYVPSQIGLELCHERRNDQLSMIKIDSGFMSMLNHIKQPDQEEEESENIDFNFGDMLAQKNVDDHQIYSQEKQRTQKPIAFRQLISQSGTMQCQVVRSIGPWSIGCSKESTECSIQVAYVQLIANSKRFIYIQNQFFISSCANPLLIKNQIANALALRIQKASQKGEKFRVFVVLPLLPGFAGEVHDPESKILKLQMYWQYETICRGKNSLLEQLKKSVPFPEKYIKFVGLRTHDRLSMEHPPETQIIYVHSKLMIVDDDYAILGSANINDRSLRGKRDSEICLVSKDNNRVRTLINGVPIEVSASVSHLRKRLFSEHFGLFSQKQLDPLSDYNWALLAEICLQNTQIYREMFACYPDDQVKRLSQIEGFKKQACLQKYEQLKDLIRGNAVEYPMKFLEDENLNLRANQKQYLMPASFAT